MVEIVDMEGREHERGGAAKKNREVGAAAVRLRLWAEVGFETVNVWQRWRLRWRAVVEVIVAEVEEEVEREMKNLVIFVIEFSDIASLYKLLT